MCDVKNLVSSAYKEGGVETWKRRWDRLVEEQAG